MNFGNSKPELMAGAKNAVETCLAVQPGEHVALIADQTSIAVAGAELRSRCWTRWKGRM